MNLNDSIENATRINPHLKSALSRLGILNVEDLLYHFPTRYGDTSEMRNISNLAKGDTAVIFGTISKLKTKKGFRTKIPMAEGVINDGTGEIKVVWFNQPYLAKMTPEGALVRAEGKVSERKGTLYLSNPKIEEVTKVPDGVGDSLFKKPNGENEESMRIYPVYPESRGLSSNWIYHVLQKIFKSGILENFEDPIPKDILEKYHLPTWKTAMVWMHTPKSQNDALSARKRFAFEEVFFIQLEKQGAKRAWQKNKTFIIEKSDEKTQKFIARFPFTLTNAQQKAIDVVLVDFEKGHAMSRLLEGDVGSGKTAVAATTAYNVVTTKPANQNYGNLQVAYMAPTEILATQHFESFIEYFRHMPINIGLITGAGCRKFPSKVNPGGWTNISRAQLLKWVANGEIPILIGTHALIQKTVKFKNLAYVIVDEQHRFGTHQRQALVRKLRPEPPEAVAELPENKADTFVYKDLSYTIRGLLHEIKKNLGLGHKEMTYEKAFVEELKNRKLVYEREIQIPITYRNKKIGVYQPDFVIDDKIIVEFKSVPFLGPREKKQLWGYLKNSKYKLAFLVNFCGGDLEIERVIYGTAKSTSSEQRLSFNPHLLSMTATPIPRTLALTIFGDLDLTLLDEMPAGRKQIITEIIAPEKRNEVYEKIRAELKTGRQVYIVCPRIDEPDPDKQLALQARSVKAEAKRLKKDIFPEYEIDILHSKMKDADKEETMVQFKAGDIDILCATSVVEVGVNVPNATIIIIEGAERFGLAQLHQLRGRVLRSNHQAYCFIFTETKSAKSMERLTALKKAKNGFELAELDLQLRGAGELYGQKQWGVSDIAMEALKNIKMVEAARTESSRLLDEDETLDSFPTLKTEVERRKNSVIHFE